MRTVFVAIVLCSAGELVWSDSPPKAREALQPFNDLIGAWKGTGIPEGSREEQQRGFWVENMTWEWRFQGDNAWLNIDFQDGKNFRRGELRYLPDKNNFQLTLRTVDDKQQVFSGALDKRVLTLSRGTPDETQRLTVRMLHANRFLYSYAVRPQAKTVYTPVYQVGVTRKDVPFAQGSGQPECIVSGGLGTTPVTYQGKTYYVCCSGCRDEFLANPEKYIKEAQTKKKRP